MTHAGKMTAAILFSIGLLVSAQPAAAGQPAAELQRQCQLYKKAVGEGLTKNEAFFDAGLCRGFLEGAALVWTMNSQDICVKGNVTTEHFVDIFLAWAQANPQQMGMAQEEAVKLCLEQKFPCPAQ